jgi:hypothetical protein
MADHRETERLLSHALAPIEPPAALSARVERHLELVAGAAADELADWELSAMRDPRNWMRPVAAMAVGSAAAGALVLVRARQHARSRSGGRPVERAAREVARGLRRRLAR